MPANTALVFSTFIMQRDVSIWGEDAEDFNPDRWKSDEGVKGKEGFVAWHLGPRMVCPVFILLDIGHKSILNHSVWVNRSLLQHFIHFSSSSFVISPL